MEKIFAATHGRFCLCLCGQSPVIFERRIANLERGAGAVDFSSGMVAIEAAVLNVVESGDEIISRGGIVIVGKNFHWDAEKFPKLAEYEKFGSSNYLVQLRAKILRFETKAKAFDFLNALCFALKVSNIGDVRTLAVHPASTIYLNVVRHEKEFTSVTYDLVRVNVGIEELTI